MEALARKDSLWRDLAVSCKPFSTFFLSGNTALAWKALSILSNISLISVHFFTSRPASCLTLGLSVPPVQTRARWLFRETNCPFLPFCPHKPANRAFGRTEMQRKVSIKTSREFLTAPFSHAGSPPGVHPLLALLFRAGTVPRWR